ncbi:putative pentatricopeptide repeat-containing protein [Drosera capensis]
MHILSTAGLRHSPPLRRRLLHSLPRSELITRICRLVLHHRAGSITKLPFTFSEDLIVDVLRSLKLNPDASLSFFKLARKQQQFGAGLKSMAMVVHILSRARNYEETRSYLNEIVGFGRKRGCEVCVVWGELVRVYKEFKFSPTVFDMVLKVYVERGLVKDALYVFDEICRLGRVPSLRSCNGLLSGLVRKGKCDAVVGVYDQMMRIGVVPDVFMCTIMVNAYWRNDGVERAVRYVEEMDGLGFEVNVATYNSLINGYVSMGDVEGAKRVMVLMSEKGLEMNVVTYTLLIKGYCKLLKMNEAEDLMQEMKEKSIVADQHTYGALVDGYCKNKEMDKAVGLKNEMLSSGCTGEAYKVCDQMISEGIKPSVVTYNTLLKGLLREGAFTDMFSLWRLMLKRGVHPNEVGYGTLLDGVFKMGDLDQALELWKEILMRGFRSRVLFDTVYNGLCKLRKMNEACEVLAKMREYGLLAEGELEVGNECSHGAADLAGLAPWNRNLVGAQVIQQSDETSVDPLVAQGTGASWHKVVLSCSNHVSSGAS